MRIRMLEATPVAGVDRFKGQVGEVPDNVGRRLVQLGKAQEVGDDEDDDEPAAAPRGAGKGGKGGKGGKADQADGADQAAEGKAEGEA